ncbi:MAG: 1,4-dihydroxy-6-naphthoate synthase [Planctomycetota bacterium]
MSDTVHLGLSTCPNDTFLIHGLYSGAVDPRGLSIEYTFADVQELNQGLRAGRFHVGKGSYALAIELEDRLDPLPVGSALGFGVGPVLLAAETRAAALESPRVLCPGADTTATLLLRILHPEWTRIEQVVFSEIMPALSAGAADLGVCIHEGRFTYQAAGLHCLEDLGATWEQQTGAPLPLGGLFARRDLDPELRTRIEALLVESLEYGWAHREETVVTMTRFAQEMTPAVQFQHVDLYVNGWTRDLGDEGRRAIALLRERAQTCRLRPS